ncbi:MAG: sulfatase-like hydrolase/transferase [Verrucomicrobiota bacterium]
MPHISNIRFAILLKLLLPLVFLSAGSFLQGTDKPNIVLFLVDDMGLMDSSVPFLTNEKGQPQKHPLNEFYRTPNMERLAKQGSRLSQFYAMSVCSPTRVSIMTGQTSARHKTTQFIKPETNNAGTYGAQDWKWEGITKDHVTLPAELRKAGYRTIHSGKAHFGPNDSYGADPTNIGFDINIAGCAYGQPGSYYGEDHYGWAKKGREKRAVPGLEKYHGTDTHLTEACTVEMNAAIKEAVDDGQPFFAYLSHYAVHTPFQSDPRFAENYADEDKKSLAAFATLIEGMDKSLGDVLDQLEKLGVAENTLVLFVGDNGSDAPVGDVHEVACAAPLRGKKGTHYEGGMRVPFIAAWAKPNAKNSHQIRFPIATNAINDREFGTVCDLYTTTLIAAGLNPTDPAVGQGKDGISLWPLFADGGKRQFGFERRFLMHFPHSHRSAYYTAFRQGDWKLVYHYRHDPERGKIKWPQTELFNLADDPYETTNLSEKDPDQLRTMMDAMKTQLDLVDAQYPLADDKKSLLKPTL